MKKPVSGYAIILWALAALYPIVDIWVQWRAMTYTPYGSYLPLHTNVFQYLHELLESVGLVSGGLMAAGFAIELLDQIRWNALPPERRNS